MRRVFLLLGACLVMSLLFAPAAGAQQDLADIRANAADTIPLPADGTCPPGYVTVNAPLCAEESPNTPGRIFGYGEGDLALIQQPAAATQPAAQQNPYCPNGGFPATAPGDPGEGSLQCFATQEAANVYSATGETPHDVAPPIRPTAPAQPAAPMTELPDTGGLSFEVLALGAGVVLLGGGLLLKRRLS